ncbi:MAG TPA: LysR substrate-binding domain-containing protein [Acetobacteraceae bacterium]|nr:LysR substrate-binding domain-containing protein [Acetobacteraceae bacterium]
MSGQIPPLAALRAFAAVARLGSFVRAAEALHVSTSAVSHQVRGLEDTLGARLLTRARNGAGRSMVTPEGAALQRAVEQAFAQLGAACEAVRDRRKRPVLTISASGSVASLWLAPLLAKFAARHPSVQWQMRSIEDEAPDMVREGLDLAVLRVRRGAVTDGDRLLFSETVFPVCSPSLRLAGSPEELPRHTLLQEEHVASPEKDWSTWLELLGYRADAKVTIVRFHTFSAALAAAIAGAGIALGRQPLIDFELAAGRLVRPFPGRTLPGSADFIVRRRPGLERDRHVGQLAEYLLGTGERNQVLSTVTTL